ncbi:MAG: helix-turn-helix transcriptional regulator [Deltaproteobacteria bacterium]|nr:helix-turn-helix transcriptional regulator [Deltaproteobacteria bacterium]
MEKAIRFIEENFKSQPPLDKIAESVHLSKFHFDRIFKRWVGISPMQFQASGVVYPNYGANRTGHSTGPSFLHQQCAPG